MEFLHITKGTGKMSLIDSINTSHELNEFCQKCSEILGSICEKCYGRKTWARYGHVMRGPMEKNTRLLSEGIIPWDNLPRVNAKYFRFSSFGDLMNDNHFINILNICRKNPETTFAIWTKNPGIMRRVFKSEVKPDNLCIVVSSLYVNVIGKFDGYDFIDKVFTVWDKKGAKENNVNLNCIAKEGKRKRCIDCLQCYQKYNGITEIHELIK